MNYKAPCGCKSSDSAWIAMCATHQAEFDALHKRAAREKSHAELLGCYYLVPEPRDQADTV